MMVITKVSERPVTEPGGTIGALARANLTLGLAGNLDRNRKRLRRIYGAHVRATSYS